MDDWSFVATTKMNQNGAVTIPVGLRKQMGLGQGDTLAWFQDGTGRIFAMSLSQYDAYLETLAPEEVKRLLLVTMGLTEDPKDEGASVRRLRPSQS